MVQRSCLYDVRACQPCAAIHARAVHHSLPALPLLPARPPQILSGPSLSAGRPFKFLGRLGQVGAGGPVHVDAARLSWSKAPIASSQELVTLAATPTGLAVSVSGRGAVRGGGTLPLADLGRLQYGRGGTVTITKPGFVFTARQPALVPRYGRPRFAPHLLL